MTAIGSKYLILNLYLILTITNFGTVTLQLKIFNNLRIFCCNRPTLNDPKMLYTIAIVWWMNTNDFVKDLSLKRSCYWLTYGLWVHFSRNNLFIFMNDWVCLRLTCDAIHHRCFIFYISWILFIIIFLQSTKNCQ